MSSISLSSKTIAEIQALSASDMRNVTVSGASTAQIQALSSTQVRSLGTSAISSMTSSQMMALDTEDIFVFVLYDFPRSCFQFIGKLIFAPTRVPQEKTDILRREAFIF